MFHKIQETSQDLFRSVKAIGRVNIEITENERVTQRNDRPFPYLNTKNAGYFDIFANRQQV
jgi:hypothetical protein